jgi:hypothetical protein
MRADLPRSFRREEKMKPPIGARMSKADAKARAEAVFRTMTPEARSAAMAEYKAVFEATLAKTERLRALRLARAKEKAGALGTG